MMMLMKTKWIAMGHVQIHDNKCVFNRFFRLYPEQYSEFMHTI